MSLTVFAMFFGAGNLIFPVFLAWQAGDNVVSAFSGFALSAIGLPVLALVAITKTDGLEKLGDRVHPLFSRIFAIAIYLAIGPCLAIPRTASTSQEMVALALGGSSRLSVFIYCTLFFAIAALVARRPEKLSKRLGRVLCPLLIILIAILTTGSILISGGGRGSVMPPYDISPLEEGFVAGYQTMDAIAGLAFGLVLVLNMKSAGVDDENLGKECVIASLGGGFLILAVYIALALTGVSSHAFVSNATNGTDILSAAANAVFPQGGRVLVAAIFILACLNTCISLLSSCGQYFSSLYPKISRDAWIAIFALVSLAIANVGLDQIISLSSPLLEFLYPVAMTLMVLAFMPHGESLVWTYRLPAASSAVFSLVSIISGHAFLWVVPTIVLAIAGSLIDRRLAGGSL